MDYNITEKGWECPDCGRYNSTISLYCGKCNHEFTDYRNREDTGYRIWKNDLGYYICSNCEERMLSGLDDSCPKCGIKWVGSQRFETLVCPACKTNQKNLDAEYCIQCGEALFTKKIVEVKQCPDCKTNYEITDKFCDKDGKKLIIKKIEVEDQDNPNFELAKSSEKHKVSQKAEQIYKEKELPMNWYRFITYGLCPIAVIASLLWIPILYDKYSYNDYFGLAVFGMLVNTVLCAIVGISLHKKTTWSWKFLIGLYAFNGLFGRIELLDEWGSMSYFMFVIFVNALTTLPNYIYYSKRSHLFVNKFEL